MVSKEGGWVGWRRDTCSKMKCTLINTRTQATLALGARWNGWGAFLSSSKRNTLWEKESSQLYTVEMPYYY